MHSGTTYAAGISDSRGAMRYQKCLIIPTILFVANLISAIGYLSAGDWKRAVYWAASSACIASVSF